MTLTVSRSTGQLLCRLSFSLVLANVFLLGDELLDWDSGRKTTEVQCVSHHIVARLHDLSTVDFDLDHLADVAFVRLSAVT